MRITEPTLLAHPADLLRAARYAAERELPLQLSTLTPRGKVILIDPTNLILKGA